VRSTSTTGPASALVLALLAAASLQGAPAPPPAGESAPSGEEILRTAPSRFALLEGKKVHFKVVGEGSVAVVLVHGWTCDMTFWSGQVPLASSHRLLLVDLPGHGRSDPPTAWSMDAFARAVEAAMREAGIERAVLVGHSMGTPVVRQFRRLFPARTIALVALDGTLRPYFTDPEKARAYVAPLEGDDGRANFLKRLDGMVGPVKDDALRASVRARMAACPQATVAGAARAMFDPAIWKDDPVGAPLLSILAANPFWDDAYRAYVRALAPAAEFVDVAGTSHFLMLEKPGVVNAALAAFVARTVTPPGKPGPTLRTRG
jgi:pimeloyl-ACP methyl ester carboxylesterase